MSDMEYYASTTQSNERTVYVVYQENGQRRLQKKGRHVAFRFHKRKLNWYGEDDGFDELRKKTTTQLCRTYCTERKFKYRETIVLQ